MHGYDPGYGPPPPHDMYAPGPEVALLPGPGLLPRGQPPHPLDPIPGPAYHDQGLGPPPHGPPPHHGEDFSSAFGDPDCVQTIEGKV